ncbi:MAG: hypothetical protein L3J08_03495 [Flavobacteriaceae bacterium]|nr:hypothetical protein [Flavobacteriaceae bacterium]
MIFKKIQKNISQFWAVGIILIYSLLMAEYFNSVTKEVTSIQGLDTSSSIYLYIASFNYFIVILTSFAVWLISSFLFHMFAILLGDNEVKFKEFIKYTGVIYIFPAIGFAFALYLFEAIKLPKDNTLEFFKVNKSMIAIGWIINISSSLAFILAVPIIKYLYHINWLKSFGAVVIPIASIYLLGQFFSEFVL